MVTGRSFLVFILEPDDSADSEDARRSFAHVSEAFARSASDRLRV